MPSSALTPRTHAMLASAAAHRSLLLEVATSSRLRHLHWCLLCIGTISRDTNPCDCSTRSTNLNCHSGTVRGHAKLVTKQLDGLIAVEGRHHSALACRKWLDAGGALQMRKGPASCQVLAVSLSTCRGWCWIVSSHRRAAIKVKAWSCRHCSRGAACHGPL